MKTQKNNRIGVLKMDTIGRGWEEFVKRSKNKRPAPQTFLEKAKSEFYDYLRILGNNERPTTLAAGVCLQYPDHDVASHLDDHVREILSQ